LANVTEYLGSNGYKLTALADPNGTLVQPLQIGYLPTYYFLDQSGHIKKVTVGVLSSSELQSGLVGSNVIKTIFWPKHTFCTKSFNGTSGLCGFLVNFDGLAD